MDYEKIIREMTLEEKLNFLTGQDLNQSCALERFGINNMKYHDGPFGLRLKIRQENDMDDRIREIRSAFPNEAKGEEAVSTAFPTGSAMGATWDPELIFQVGKALGEEYKAYGIQAVLGPSMNIKRHPLCGRNFEYFSEDPILTEKLSQAYVQGVQSQKVAACPKHFALNNQERGRFSISSEVDERTMREIYLRAFEGVVKNASPWSVMCAYNRINGVYASENKQLLQDILREEWEFDGIIISDWGAVKNRAYSLLASVEMCMPYQEEAYEQLQEAYHLGIIDDKLIDGALERLFLFYDRTRGEKGNDICDFEANHRIALQAARESIVLLKNENCALPLEKEKLKRILVVGSQAVKPFIGGDGSSRVANPYRISIPLEELEKRLGKDVEVDFMEDNQLHTYENEIGVMEGVLSRKASQADAVVIFAGQDFSCSSEAMDRTNIELEPYMEYIIRICRRVNQRVIVVLNAGSGISAWNWEHCADAVLMTWLGGQGMGQAVAETLCGENNPSGKLAETIPRRLADAPGINEYPGDWYKTVYSEGLLTGYRHYDYHRIVPDFEFGFGLSYSRFSYDGIRLEEDGISFFVTNESDREGAEIVQVYIEYPPDSWVSHPEKELKAFQRIHLKERQRFHVKIRLSREAYVYYNTALKKWMTEAGTYTIWVGSSSRKLPLSIQKTWDNLELLTMAPGGE